MLSENRNQLFVSYARPDAVPVEQFVNALRQEYQARALPIDVWIDSEDLRPGEQWERAIQRALLNSFGLLIFVSPASMSSAWVRNELAVAASATYRFVVPIILKQVPDLPSALAQRQWEDLSNRLTPGAIRDAAANVADATARYLKKDHVAPPIRQAEVPKLAESLAREARGQGKADEKSAGPPNSVFVVHEKCRRVARRMSSRPLQPIPSPAPISVSSSLLERLR